MKKLTIILLLEFMRSINTHFPIYIFHHNYHLYFLKRILISFELIIFIQSGGIVVKDVRGERYSASVGDGDPDLDKRLSDELDKVNSAATAGVDAAREITVKIVDNSGELAAGMSGWSWGVAAGIGMTWVRENTRGDGLGSRLLKEFEAEALARGCTHVFTTSFTFQAPGFYERHGYKEIFRWEGVPTPDAADVHFRKELTRS
jgi:GNAT superfamily N-acetyltransferase